MNWFTRDFFTFFGGLKEHNNKEWFHDNKKFYEQAVKEPFEELVEDLINRIRGDDAGFDLAPKDAIFRIHRDVRFSQNKEPYKTNVAAIISPSGRKSPDLPGFYLHFGIDEVLVGGGVYMVEKDNIRNIRSAIAAAPDEFDALLAAPAFRTKYGVLRGEKNKIIPAEFRAAYAQQPAIAHKQFYYMADLAPETLLEDSLPDLLMEYYEAGLPVNAFLARAMSAA